MKRKFNVLILAVLICLTSLFVGCGKTNSASVDGIIGKFQVEINPYLTTDSNIGSAIITKKDTDAYRFLFSPNDNNDLRQIVNSTQKSKFSQLSNDSDYMNLLLHASKYFNNKFNNSALISYRDKFNLIEQNKLNKLYSSVEETVKQIATFGQKYRKLSTCFVSTDLEALNTAYALDELLNQYKVLIGQVLQLNLDTQDIIDNSLFTYKNISNGGEIPDNEINRIVDAFELYVTEYIYQRYLVFDSNTIIDLKDNQLLTQTNLMIQKVQNARNDENRVSSNNVELYNYLRLVEKSMYNTIALNRNAVKVLNGKVPTTNDSNYNYKINIYNNFVDYEQQLLSYVNALITLI